MPVDQHARDEIADLKSAVHAHVSVCEECRRADEQWRNSATRVLEEIKAKIDKHVSTLYRRVWSILWAAVVLFGGATIFMFQKLMGW